MTVLLMKQGLVEGLASYFLYASSMALKGILRKGPRNIRTAFKMWLVLQVLIQVLMVLFYMKIGRLELTDSQIVEYLVLGDNGGIRVVDVCVHTGSEGVEAQ